MAASQPAGASGSSSSSDLPVDAVLEVLTEGTLEVTGRLVDASNLSLVGTVTHDGTVLECVYKPVRGERPLWDFPDGTLAQREVAAYRLARMAGWDCVPPTVLRPGPFGEGMVQLWIDALEYDSLVDLLPVRKIPKEWRTVLRARDEGGSAVAVAHAVDDRLALLAAFDAVTNNADRKASHILPTQDGRVLGVDHGLTLHRDPKLRTILWGFAGMPLSATVLEGLRRLSVDLAGDEEFQELITVSEWAALLERIAGLVADPRYPEPPVDRTPIPWPPL